MASNIVRWIPDEESPLPCGAKIYAWSRELHRYAAHADSENTQRAYAADCKHFMSWSAKRNKVALPTSPEDVAH